MTPSPLPSAHYQSIILLLVVLLQASFIHSAKIELNFMLGTPELDWEYPFKGWSYYIRAFNMMREQPRSEVGWGQWSKPNAPDNFNSVCGIHPMGFTCEDGTTTETSNCAGTYTEMEKCDYWVCGEEEKGGIRGSIEGGMGYWPGYTLEKSQVTWMVPGSTTANYEMFGGTFLNDRPQPCLNLGGAVRISNRLLVPNDFISFEGGANIDGFLGYMLQATPIGKRAATDTANYWTIIADSANFKGPVMYMSTWFWDSRLSWHPQSKNWASPDAALGYIARGFEGRISAMQSETHTDGSNNKFARTTEWGMPLDSDDLHSTLFTGHSRYPDDWLTALLDGIMDGTETDSAEDAKIKDAATAARINVGCGSTDSLETKEAFLEFEGEGETFTINGLGVTATDASDADIESLGCPVKYLLDKTKLNCSGPGNMCLASKFFTVGGERKATDDVPPAAQSSIPDFPIHRVDNRRATGPPAGPERQCFENPGPAAADSRMYCTRTNTKSWIGFKWYRFVDQPELTNVFASLPEGERETAKAYMQSRIEKIHALGKDVPWFDFPGGEDALPAAKVSIDESLLLNPPDGMEVGFVPIPITQRMRVRPTDCEVVVGSFAEEPEPLEDDYYDNFDEVYFGREQFECSGTGVDGMTYPGSIFGLPPDPTADRLNNEYVVPIPDLAVEDAVIVPVSNPVIALDDVEGVTASPTPATIDTKSPTPANDENPATDAPTNADEEMEIDGAASSTSSASIFKVMTVLAVVFGTILF